MEFRALRAARGVSFGNGNQAIEIAKARFRSFFKSCLKSLDNQADFDSAIRGLESFRSADLIQPGSMTITTPD
jgi:hypothetical protein